MSEKVKQEVRLSASFLALLNTSRNILTKHELLIMTNGDNVQVNIVGGSCSAHIFTTKDHVLLPYDKFGIVSVSDLVAFCENVNYPATGTIHYVRETNASGRMSENLIIRGGKTSFKVRTADLAKFDKFDMKTGIMSREQDDQMLAARFILKKTDITEIIKVVSLTKSPNEFMLKLGSSEAALYFSGNAGIQSSWDIPQNCYSPSGFEKFKEVEPSCGKLFHTDFLRWMKNYGFDFDIDLRLAKGRVGLVKAYTEVPALKIEPNLPRIRMMIAGAEQNVSSLNSNYAA